MRLALGRWVIYMMVRVIYEVGIGKMGNRGCVVVSVETAGQQIVRELVDQYLVQLDQTLTQSREEFL